MQKEQKADNNKVDRNKVYFLIVVIAALLGINGYLYIKDREQSSKTVDIATEKDRLKLEVEKIEVELDRVSLLNVTLNDRLTEQQQLARTKIEELKLALRKGELTQNDLDQAKGEVSSLKDFVKSYNNQISILEQENSFLKSHSDSLKSSLSNSNSQKESLRKENRDLSRKVKLAAALKTGDIKIGAYRVRDNGKNVTVTKASGANKLTVDFSILPNDLADKNYRKIYLRIIDPAGNLIADENNMFEADGQKMQYSTNIQISYNNDNTRYKIDWINPQPFVKGTYSAILYTDGYAMGNSSVTLR
jgi:hypothetical protein